MSTVSYPYDDSGRAATNLVSKENQILSLGNNTPYRYFIPTFAPFYETNFALEGVDALGNPVELVRNVDYNFNLSYIGATRANGVATWGGINIINQTLQGVVKVTYQCVGGKYSADRDFVVKTIAENNYNPRVVAWDQVTSVQELFPPSRHPQDLDTFTGYRDLIDSINNLHDHPDEFQTLKSLIWNHMLNHSDPHETLKLLDHYTLKVDFEAAIRLLTDQVNLGINQVETNRLDIQNVNNRVSDLEKVLDVFKEEIRVVDELPSAFVAKMLIVNKPHVRFMMWSPGQSTYIRAPWHRPGMLAYSYHNPGSILGYLPVRADAVYNKVDYPDLAIELGLGLIGTFTLVEMRGEFLRVLDNGRGVDVRRDLLSSQASQNLSHNHEFVPLPNSSSGHLDLPCGIYNSSEQPARKAFVYVGYDQLSTVRFPVTSSNPGGTITLSGGDESRPTNVAVPIWISY